MTQEMERWRADFLNKFASVPGPLRNEIVAVVENQPYTWAAAYLEISNKTALGDEVLRFLKTVKII